MENFNKAADELKKIKREFSMMLWNVRSIKDLNKFLKFKSSISDLVSCKRIDTVDWLIITETWIKTNDDFRLYAISNYNVAQLTRSKGSKGGGISVYIRDDLNYLEIDQRMTDDIEAMLIDVSDKDKHSFILSIYRPPKGSLSTFVDEIERYLNNYNDLIIVGDLNVDMNAATTASKSVRETFESYNYVLINNSATRKISGTLIDHVWIKDTKAEFQIITVDKNFLSDHSAVITSKLSEKVRHHHNDKTIIKRVNINKAIENIKGISIDLNGEDGVQKSVEKLITICQDQVDECTENFTIKHDDRAIVPAWADEKFAKKMNHINNLHRKIFKRKKNNLPTNQLEQKMAALNQSLNDWSNKKAKNYFMKRLNERKIITWDVINEVCGRKQKPKVTNLKNDDLTISDKSQMAKLFNETFSKTTGIREEVDESCSTGVDYSVRDSFFLCEIGENEMRKYLNELSSKKATGSDRIPAKIWKELKFSHCKLLTEQFNKIIREGNYPNILKLAKVIPIYKKGDKTDANNYRPISLLPTLNKLFERIIYDQLYSFLERNNVLDQHQYGFRANRSTQDAVGMLLSRASKLVDRKRKVAIIFLDIAKAFDSVSHDVLLKRIERLGVRGHVNELIRSYLQYRSQYVEVENEKSDSINVARGVPQGSCLGPLLFLMLITDMKHLNLKSLALKFADDTCLICDGATVEELTLNVDADLEILRNYYKITGLKLNLCKSQYIRCYKSKDDVLVRYMNTAGVERVENCKYLGYQIDGKLKLIRNNKLLIEALKNTTRVISIARHHLPANCLTSFLHAYFISRINTAGFTLLRARAGDLQKMQRQMNRSLKLIHKLDFHHPTIDLFTTYERNLLPVRGYAYLSAMVQVKRCLLSSDESLQKLEVIEGGRRAGTVKFSRYKRVCLEKDLLVTGIKLYNCLPQNLREITNLKQFKAKAKTFLLERREEILSENHSISNL